MVGNAIQGHYLKSCCEVGRKLRPPRFLRKPLEHDQGIVDFDRHRSREVMVGFSRSANLLTAPPCLKKPMVKTGAMEEGRQT
jgi:hypothetical protein